MLSSTARMAWLMAGLLLAGFAAADNAELEAEAGSALAAQDFEKAARLYDQLTDKQPENGAYWFNLGAAQQGLEQYEKASKSYQESHRLGNQTGVSAFRTARAYGQLGAEEKALTWLETAAGDGMRVSAKLVRTIPEFEGLLKRQRFESALAGMAPCGSTAHRQFDFWVGEWDVRPVNPPPGPAAPPAFNSITLSEDGCTLIERYKSGPVYTGTSLSFYDRNRDLWHQTWIDNQGGPLYIEGTFEDGKMALWGPEETQPRSRVTWEAQPDGSVTQHWQTTADEGETWTTVFYGRYTRQTETAD